MLIMFPSLFDAAMDSLRPFVTNRKRQGASGKPYRSPTRRRRLNKFVNCLKDYLWKIFINMYSKKNININYKIK